MMVFQDYMIRDYARWELTYNILYATNNLSIGTSPNRERWMHDTMVTPAITGLLNSNVLNAMLDVGIYSTSGDLSRPEISVAGTPYYARYTDWLVDPDNRGKKILIVPRYGTNVYYNTWNHTGIETQYNFRIGNSPPWVTFEEIMQRDAEDFGSVLGAFEHTQYMFHQQNLIFYNYTDARTQLVDRKSTLTIWFEHVNEFYRMFFTLPLLTLGQVCFLSVCLPLFSPFRFHCSPSLLPSMPAARFATHAGTTVPAWRLQRTVPSFASPLVAPPTRAVSPRLALPYPRKPWPICQQECVRTRMVLTSPSSPRWTAPPYRFQLVCCDAAIVTCKLPRRPLLRSGLV
jgi:hypothetical protein